MGVAIQWALLYNGRCYTMGVALTPQPLT
jgi:hypothetical protein